MKNLLHSLILILFATSLAACSEKEDEKKEDTTKKTVPAIDILSSHRPDLQDIPREQYDEALIIRKAIVDYYNLPDHEPATVKAFIAARPEYLKQDDQQYIQVSAQATYCAMDIEERFGIPEAEALPACWQSYDVIKIVDTYNADKRYPDGINKLGMYLLEGK